MEVYEDIEINILIAYDATNTTKVTIITMKRQE